MSECTLVDFDRDRLDTLPCCGIKALEHEGRIEKTCWMRKYLAKGAHGKVLRRPDGRQCGYIEYLPGEYAWRGVNAKGYMFIHCIWTFYRDIQHRGYGRKMVEACVRDARAAGMLGVAAMARQRPWMAKPDLFLKAGFAVVDTAPPDYQLLALKFDATAPDPSFKNGWERKLTRYAKGLTIIRAGQCPHAVKFAREIAEAAEQQYGLTPQIADLKSHLDAQNAPTPFAVFAIIHNGRLLADHPVSRTRFHNIMRKLPVA